MRLKSFIIGFVLFAGVFFCSFGGYIYGVNARDKKGNTEHIVTKQNNEIPDVFLSNSNTVAEKLVENFKEKYILRENENKVALFIKYANGDEQIHSEYDICVNLLPKDDRARLAEGIEMDSPEDAITLIEDYME